MTQLQDVVVELAQTPWVLLAVGLLSMIDGFFPPVPSESVIIAVAALGAAGNGPAVWLLIPVAAVGAFLGDQIAYLIGRAIPLDRIPVLRGPAGAKALTFASQALVRRGTVLIVSARFVPVGRIAVNMTAGATGFPHLRFMVVDAVAAVLWASYSTLLGMGAGAVLHEHPLVAVAVGVAGGVLLGYLLDRAIAVLQRRAGVDLPEPEPLHLDVDETGRWDPEEVDHERERGHAHLAWEEYRNHARDRRDGRGGSHRNGTGDTADGEGGDRGR